MNILQFFDWTFLNESAVETFLRNCSFCTLFLSMMFYWIQTAFSSKKKIAHFEQRSIGAAPSQKSSIFEGLPFFAVLQKSKIFAFVLQSKKRELKMKASNLPNFGTATMILSNFLLMFLLIVRWGSAGHFPLSNLYESLMFLSWSCTVIHLILDHVVKTAAPPSLLASPPQGPLFNKEGAFGRTTAFLPASPFFAAPYGPPPYAVSLLQKGSTFNFREKKSILESPSTSPTFSPSLVFLEKKMGKGPSAKAPPGEKESVGKGRERIIKLDATLLTKLIGSITSPSALFTNAFATFSLPPEMQKASPLVPALQSNWLMMHVTVMIISYSALILGSLLSIAFLILISSKPQSASSFRVPRLDAVTPKTDIQNFESPFLLSEGSSSASLSERAATRRELLPTDTRRELEKQSISAQREGALPFQLPLFELRELENKLDQNDELLNAKNNLAWNFDNLSYRVLGIGFPFLTIGILSGAVWANEAWGSYWSWDPKETWALLTWLIFAIYLHARITKGWQGKKPAIIASFGFLAIWVCFLGVNLIGEGLHSYGWFS